MSPKSTRKYTNNPTIRREEINRYFLKDAISNNCWVLEKIFTNNYPGY